MHPKGTTGPVMSLVTVARWCVKPAVGSGLRASIRHVSLTKRAPNSLHRMKRPAESTQNRITADNAVQERHPKSLTMTTDQHIREFKLKKTVSELEAAVGSGTSMITLMVPPRQLLRANKMLVQEYGVSANIKSRV